MTGAPAGAADASTIVAASVGSGVGVVLGDGLGVRAGAADAWAGGPDRAAVDGGDPGLQPPRMMAMSQIAVDRRGTHARIRCPFLCNVVTAHRIELESSVGHRNAPNVPRATG
jgi:hypothetical protein